MFLVFLRQSGVPGGRDAAPGLLGRPAGAAGGQPARPPPGRPAAAGGEDGESPLGPLGVHTSAGDVASFVLKYCIICDSYSVMSF